MAQAEAGKAERQKERKAERLAKKRAATKANKLKLVGRILLLQKLHNGPAAAAASSSSPST